MRALLMLLVTATVIICPLTQYVTTDVQPTLPTPVPTLITPAAKPAPRIDVTASATSLRVGETVTLTGIPSNIGIPYYTLMLSSGASVTITYDNQVQQALGANPQFELVSAAAGMGEVTFVLRALAPGTVDVTISATGEVTSAEGAYMWGYGASAPVTLTITE